MTGIVVLAVLALTIIAALEVSNRRHSSGLPAGATNDRDLARTKLDLLALGASAKPFTHKPATTSESVVQIRRARLHTTHGRHAA
ncbi:hypothetical protein [Kribbella sp. DT2]|uniref:hypothetical protein n=1 Tax=Kribbella sp. DT2 TaxID=3393427 RepID=UPI003CF76D5A